MSIHAPYLESLEPLDGNSLELITQDQTLVKATNRRSETVGSITYNSYSPPSLGLLETIGSYDTGYYFNLVRNFAPGHIVETTLTAPIDTQAGSPLFYPFEAVTINTMTPDGSYIASAKYNNWTKSIHIMKNDGTHITYVKSFGGGGINPRDLMFTDDGQYLLTLGEDTSVPRMILVAYRRVGENYSISGSPGLQDLGGTFFDGRLTVAPDMRKIFVVRKSASAADAGFVLAFDFDRITGSIGSPTRTDMIPTHSIAFSPSSDAIVLGTFDGVRMARSQDSYAKFSPIGFSDPLLGDKIFKLAYSRDGNYLAAITSQAGGFAKLVVWRKESDIFNLFASLLLDGPKPDPATSAFSLQFSPDSRYILWSGPPNTLNTDTYHGAYRIGSTDLTPLSFTVGAGATNFLINRAGNRLIIFKGVSPYYYAMYSIGAGVDQPPFVPITPIHPIHSGSLT